MPSNLIAEHLRGNRKRKAPECGAYVAMIDDHVPSDPDARAEVSAQAVEGGEKCVDFVVGGIKMRADAQPATRPVVEKDALARSSVAADAFGAVEIDADPAGAALGFAAAC